jgi:ureidoglycolate hydrolase
MGFSLEGTAQVLLLETRFGSMEVEVLERHDAVTQTFVCVGGAPAVLVVAAGAGSPGEAAPPTTDELDAFMVLPGSGFILGQGTWHAPDRFPSREPGTRFVCITETETTLGRRAGRSRYVGTQVVSCKELFGRALTVRASHDS